MGPESLNQMAQWATIGQFILALIFGLFTVVATLNWKPRVPITFGKRIIILGLACMSLLVPVYIIYWLAIWLVDFFTSLAADIVSVIVRSVFLGTLMGALWGIFWTKHVLPFIDEMLLPQAKENCDE